MDKRIFYFFTVFSVTTMAMDDDGKGARILASSSSSSDSCYDDDGIEIIDLTPTAKSTGDFRIESVEIKPFFTLRQGTQSNCFLLDINNSGGRRLTDLTLCNSETPKNFCIENDSFSSAALAEIAKISVDQKWRLVFVDYDGVVAKKVIIRQKDNQQFFYLMDGTNCIVTPDCNRARALFGRNNYQKQREELLKKILLTIEEPSSEPVQQAIQIERIFDAAISLLEREELGGYSYDYAMVDNQLKDVLQKQKDEGAELFILSAKPWDQKKENFLLKDYGNIFAETDFKQRADIIEAFHNNQHKKCSYLFNKEKQKVLASALKLNESCYVQFWDDNALCVERYWRSVSGAQRSSKNCVKYAFIPYPVLSYNFDYQKYLNEMYNFLMGLDDVQLEKLRNVIKNS
jgi:hypothetical protein